MPFSWLHFNRENSQPCPLVNSSTWYKAQTNQLQSATDSSITTDSGDNSNNKLYLLLIFPGQIQLQQRHCNCSIITGIFYKNTQRAITLATCTWHIFLSSTSLRKGGLSLHHLLCKSCRNWNPACNVIANSSSQTSHAERERNAQLARSHQQPQLQLPPSQHCTVASLPLLTQPARQGLPADSARSRAAASGAGLAK